MDDYIISIIGIIIAGLSFMASLYAIYSSRKIANKSLLKSQEALKVSIKQSFFDERIDHFLLFLKIKDLFENNKSYLYSSFMPDDGMNWNALSNMVFKYMVNLKELYMYASIVDLDFESDERLSKRVKFNISTDDLRQFFMRSSYLYNVEYGYLIFDFVDNYILLLVDLLSHNRIFQQVFRENDKQNEIYNSLRYFDQFNNKRHTAKELNQMYNEPYWRSRVLIRTANMDGILDEILDTGLIDRLNDEISIK